MGKYHIHTFAKSILLIFFFLSSFIVQGQSSIINTFFPEDNFTAHHEFEHWSTENGLPQNSVRSIAQTKDGYLWLATQGGLVRFDGKDFTVFDVKQYPNLGGNRIIQLAADSSGGLWILGEDSHIAYLKNHKFVDYTPLIKNSLRTADNNNREFIAHIGLSADSLLYLQTESKIISFDYKTSRIVFSDKRKEIQNILILPDNKIFVLTKTQIFSLKDGKFVSAANEFGRNIRYLTEDRFNNYWRIYNYPKAHGTFSSQVVTSGKTFNFKHPLEIIFCDKQNRKWIAHETFGLSVIDENNKLHKVHYKYFDNSKVISIFNDNRGNLWIGTDIKGLFKIKDRTLYPISLKNGVFNDIVYPILKSKDGSIWVGAACGGIARINQGKVSYFSKKLKNSSFDCIFSLCQTSDGNILAGGQRGGIMEFDGKKFVKKYYSPEVDNKDVFSIFEQRNKNLWFGTTEGVFLYKNGKVKTYSVVNSKLPGQRVSFITEDNKGTVWFATNNGLAYLKNGKFSAIHFTDDASANYIRSIYIDDNNVMWLGTYGGGLIYFKDGKFKIISKANGLYDNYIHATVEDKYGYFWMPTNRGLFCAKKSQLLQFVNGEINKVNYTLVSRNSHLPSNEFNGGIEPQFCMPDSNTILFPSFGGVIAANLSSVKIKQNLPKTIIEYFSVDNKIKPLSKKYIVPKDYSQIEIKFTSIFFDNPDGVFFKYKLEPLDKNWKNLNRERSVQFRRLPPGNYKFKVTACNLEGNSKNYDSSIDFVVQANFYQESWFKILIVMTVIFIITLFFLLRLKLAKKREKKLNKIIDKRTESLSAALADVTSAKLNEEKEREKAERLNSEKSELLRIVTHDLKNPIGVIKNAADLISDDIENQETVDEMVKIIKSSSVRMLDSVHELLLMSEVEEDFKIKPSKFNFLELVRKVVDQNLALARKKKQIIRVKADLDKIDLTADYDKLTSCVENYLSNAIKYSPYGSEIEVIVETDDQNLIFKVKDYGPGLTEEDLKHVFGKFKKLSSRPTAGESSTGLGLSIVKRIIEMHGGEVGVKSEYKKGSLFFFILPLQ